MTTCEDFSVYSEEISSFPGEALINCNGLDIQIKGGKNRNRLMVVLPFHFCIKESNFHGIKLGEIENLGTDCPLLKIKSNKGIFIFKGSFVNISNMFLSIHCSPSSTNRVGSCTCTDIFQKALVFDNKPEFSPSDSTLDSSTTEPIDILDLTDANEIKVFDEESININSGFLTNLSSQQDISRFDELNMTQDSVLSVSEIENLNSQISQSNDPPYKLKAQFGLSCQSNPIKKKKTKKNSSSGFITSDLKLGTQSSKTNSSNQIISSEVENDSHLKKKSSKKRSVFSSNIDSDEGILDENESDWSSGPNISLDTDVIRRPRSKRKSVINKSYNEEEILSQFDLENSDSQDNESDQFISSNHEEDSDFSTGSISIKSKKKSKKK